MESGILPMPGRRGVGIDLAKPQSILVVAGDAALALDSRIPQTFVLITQT